MSLENISWVPSIGDPTIIGWLTVIVYFIVALICLKAAFISKNDKSIKIFWIFLTFFLIFLGLNKQLDLQTLFTLIGKNLAIEQGWYENKRTVQIAFIVLVWLIGTAGFIFLFKKYKNTTYEIKTALTGSIILFAFVLIRASSFHHIDIFTNWNLIGIKLNWILELGGLTVIGVGALKYLRKIKT